MPAFPSVEWFETIRGMYNRDEKFRHFGTVDAKIGVVVGDKAYEVVFEAFECLSVREICTLRQRQLRLLPGAAAGAVARDGREHQEERQGRHHAHP